MLARKVHDLRNLRLGHFVGENPTDADAVLMHMQHHPRRILTAHVEDALQNMNDKLHGRVVVIEQEHLVERRLFGLRLRLGDDARICSATPRRFIRCARFFWRQSERIQWVWRRAHELS